MFDFYRQALLMTNRNKKYFLSAVNDTICVINNRLEVFFTQNKSTFIMPTSLRKEQVFSSLFCPLIL